MEDIPAYTHKTQSVICTYRVSPKPHTNTSWYLHTATYTFSIPIAIVANRQLQCT